MSRLVFIEWEDSLGCSSVWEKIEDNPCLDPIVCRSAGFIVAENERAVLVCPHMHEADEDRCVVRSGVGDMLIPRSAIVRMVDLSENE